MRAGFIEKPGAAYFKEVEEPQIVNATDVKIQVKAAGICGSEVHAFHGRHPFRILRWYPDMNLPVSLQKWGKA